MKPTILDACCGSRMFWFDPADDRATFMDRRSESHVLPDKSSRGGVRALEIRPDVVADFTAMPFPDDHFHHVVFDPPHFRRNGATSWCRLKYGTLTVGWEAMLSKGFAECFRVLRSGGTLVLKWNECDIPLRTLLALTPYAPLYGNKSPKRVGTHWVVWVKGVEVAA